MTDNLPAVRAPYDVTTQDTDSWIRVVDNVAQLAAQISNTEFVPKGLRGSAAATAAAILYGREVGLPPMTALTQTHVIEGKPAISAEGMRGLILAAGHGIQILETNGARCVMRGRRRGEEEWSEPIPWTIDMARSAGIANKQVWKAYPRQMLQARATAELARLIFPDVIHGFRAVEEFDGVEGPAEGTGSSTASSSGTVQRKTRRAGSKGEAVVEAPRERPVLEGPPLPGEPGYTDPAGEGNGPSNSPSGHDAGSSPEPSPAPDPVEELPLDEAPGEGQDTRVVGPPPPTDVPVERPATKPDLRMVQASFKEVLSGIDDDDARRTERLAIATAITGRVVETFNDLSQREARLIADTVARQSSLADLWALLDASVDPA